LFTLDIFDADDSFAVSVDMANRVKSNQWSYMTSASTILAVIGSPAMSDCLLEAMADEIMVEQRCGIRRRQPRKKVETRRDTHPDYGPALLVKNPLKNL